MGKWYEAYYNAISDFYQAKPELICPDPEKLIDMLEDLEDQIEKIRDCRSEKEEQMKVLQNITAAMNHNDTIVQQLETTMGNLTLNAQAEDDQLKNQEDEILKMRQEVENFVCNLNMRNGEMIGVLAVGHVYQTMKTLSFTRSKIGQEL